MSRVTLYLVTLVILRLFLTMLVTMTQHFWKQTQEHDQQKVLGQVLCLRLISSTQVRNNFVSKFNLRVYVNWDCKLYNNEIMRKCCNKSPYIGLAKMAKSNIFDEMCVFWRRKNDIFLWQNLLEAKLTQKTETVWQQLSNNHDVNWSWLC